MNGAERCRFDRWSGRVFMLRCVQRAGLAALALAASTDFASAWFWDPPPPPPQPPAIHVYDYSRGPVWTPNGWAYVPVEVHFPRTRPTVIVPPQIVDQMMPPPPPERPTRRPANFDGKRPLPSMKDLGMPPPAPRRTMK